MILKLTDEFVGYMKEMNIPGMMPYPGISASASEDFASIAEKVPSTFMYLSAGYPDERERSTELIIQRFSLMRVYARSDQAVWHTAQLSG